MEEADELTCSTHGIMFTKLVMINIYGALHLAISLGIMAMILGPNDISSLNKWRRVKS